MGVIKIVGLGQINRESTIKITTKLNRKVTGLSDVLIDIYDPSSTKLVDNGLMTEIGSTGIYQYEYTLPTTLGTYTAVITCVSQRKYDELQTFTSVTPPTTTPSGGGMVVQYPAKVIDKKEQKRRKEQKELMIAIDIKLNALIKKNPKIDFTKVNDEIKKRTKELEDKMKEFLGEKENSLNKEIIQIKEDNKKGKKEFVQEVADFTDKIFQLQENTKLLPNSLNSLLTSAESSTISKFKEMEIFIKNSFDKINTQTSKFNNDIITSSGILGKTFEERIDDVKKGLSGQIDTLPKIISLQTENIKKDFGELDKRLKENIDSTNNSFLDYKKSSEDNIKGFMTNIGNNFKVILDNLDSLDLKGNITLNKNIKIISDGVDNIVIIINEIKEKNIQGFNNLEKNIFKIPNRRDLNYTQEEISNKIKDSQSNNTKKIKQLRENVENVSKEVKQSKEEQIKNSKDIKKKIEIAEEENNINAQMALLNEEKDA